MQKYDVTLTLSKRHIPIYADSYEKAMAQIGDMITGMVLMDFKEEEIEQITVNTAGSPTKADVEQKPGKSMKYSHLSPDMDKLCETLESLCFDNGYEYEEIEEEMDNIGSFEEFEPLLHWEFEPVCALELEGSDCIFPDRRRNRLFGQNGYLLDMSLDSGIAALSTITQSYELWLLEDMSLAVTFCCTMTVKGEDNYSESATFRFPVSGSYPELSGDFNAVDFLLSIEDKICDALHLD